MAQFRDKRDTLAASIMKISTGLLSILILLWVSIPASSQSPISSLRGSPIGVGDKAPDFILQDQNNKTVRLSKTRGKSAVLLVFYRGYW